jgi:UDP-2,3-diacylglucosamine pyrophosphatase LpxH
MANDIRYICMSDLHLGEEDSLLTCLKVDPKDKNNWVPDPSQPSPTMIRLVECLKYLIDKANGGRKKPILILNGDVLELALSTTDVAAMVFERFIELVMPEGEELFEGVIYIPGNHDHHLWESARETQYVEHIEGVKPGDKLSIPYHATAMFARQLSDRPTSYFLTRLMKRHEHLGDQGFTVRVAYPNLAIVNKNENRCVIVHHGHFIDSLYYLMSFVKTHIFPDREMPTTTWDIEAENFAWIDFFWSALGRSGEIGQDIELIYEKMQDKRELKKVVSGIVDQLDDRYGLPGPDIVAGPIIKKVLHSIVDQAMKTERGDKKKPLSVKGKKGLEAYVQGPLMAQIKEERGKHKKDIPRRYTLVFGHTHKPFEKDMPFEGYKGSVNVYNTGGWVVDTVKPEPRHGASIVLIDEALNATSLRMYNQKKDAKQYKVSVEESGHYWAGANRFHMKIHSLIDAKADPWRAFSKEVADVRARRAAFLRRRIRSS